MFNVHPALAVVVFIIITKITGKLSDHHSPDHFELLTSSLELSLGQVIRQVTEIKVRAHTWKCFQYCQA